MTVLEEYRLLLAEIDSWFTRCQTHHPEEISCSQGCSECCRGLFDITLLDAALLKKGFLLQPAEVRFRIREKSAAWIQAMKSQWPEFNHPFILNYRPEEEMEKLMASDNDTPCVLLDAEGRCLLYEYRPMTCRLHGLPLVDVSGEVLESEYCTENFPTVDPLSLPSLRGEFDRLLHLEAELGRCFTEELFGKAVSELDTVIAAALLIDFRDFDWRKWFAENPVKT